MAAVPPLFKTLGIDEQILIVDIGANPVDGQPPYAPMLRSGHARVVGFEPNPTALQKLLGKKGENETYLPHAVADGGEHELRICRMEGMTSLLEPNQEVLGLMHGFAEWGAVLRRESVRTVRLDDIPETEGADFIKIDIQGGELMALSNATARLADVVAIQTEVEFLEMYVGQPLFSDIDQFMREHGFMLHKFHPLVGRIIQPLMRDNSVYAQGNQVAWADAVYIRDIRSFPSLSPVKLRKLAAITHDIYQSFDLTVRLLLEHDRQTGENLGGRLLEAMTGQPLPR